MKKKYSKPDMVIVETKYNTTLLVGSGDRYYQDEYVDPEKAI